MFNYSNGLSAADVAAVTNGNNRGGMFGNDGGDWWAVIILLALFGWGGNRGFGGGFGGFGGGQMVECCGSPCATQADVRAAVDQQTLISKIDQQTYGMADIFNSLNNTINGNFRTLDGAICNLGYNNSQLVNGLSRQIADCHCDTRGAIKDVAYGIQTNGWQLSKQLSDCCCDLEKMNMQNRFDAQSNNCNTLQAIDKLGDRIIDYMASEKNQALRDENFALRLSASQSAQNNYLVNQLRPCPVPAYTVPNPYCCPTNYNTCGTNCCC